jgi:SAM-dependent methyltransferase
MMSSAPAVYPHVVAWLNEELARTGARDVLELGAGGAQYGPHLRNTRYHAFDVPASWYERHHPLSAYASADALPVRDAAADLVFCVSAFDYFPDPGRCLKEVRRCLRPHGRLLVFTYDPATLRRIHDECLALGDHPATRHHHVFDEHVLRALATPAGFDIERLALTPHPSVAQRLRRLVRPTGLRVYRLKATA